jgi:hypothetical protein
MPPGVNLAAIAGSQRFFISDEKHIAHDLHQASGSAFSIKAFHPAGSSRIFGSPERTSLELSAHRKPRSTRGKF